MRLFDKIRKAVQLPGPMSGDAEAGWNFNGFGQDMSGVQSAPSDPNGPQLPYAAEYEDYETGENMAGMASSDGFPQGNAIGAASDDGIPDSDHDLASSAGYHIVRSFQDMYGNQYTGTTPAPYGEQDSDFSGPLTD